MTAEVATASPQGLSANAPPLADMIESPFVHLYTSDIEAGLRFYRDLLGFKETFRTPTAGTPTHVELTLRGFGLGLGTVEAAKRVHGVDASPGSPAMSLAIWVEDIDRTFEHLASAGTPVVQSPHNVGKHNRIALLRDPDGNSSRLSLGWAKLHVTEKTNHHPIQRLSD